MKNRLTRDMIVNGALNMIDSAALNHKDRQDGILHQNALSIGWLQDGLDYFHRKYPYGAQIAFAAWSLPTGGSSSSVPTDYLLDMRDAIRLTSPVNLKRRLRKKSMQYILDRAQANLGSTGCPSAYTIAGDLIYYDIIAKETYTGTFAYYQMEPVLGPTDIPHFPDDYVLKEYVRLRGREWVGAIPEGSAVAYASDIIAGLRQAGIGQEAEETEFPMDPSRFHYSGNNQMGNADWMGNPVIE